MNWFNLISTFYKNGFYTKAQVKSFVLATKITPEQYESITGETYPQS